MTDPHELVAGYALDALEADERAEFEAHLQTCERCRAELADFAPTVADLSALSESAPPAELRSELLSAIGGLRQDEPEVSADSDRPASLQASGDQVSEPDSTVVPFERPVPARRRFVRVATAVIGAAALVAAIALGGWAFGRQQAIQDQRDYRVAVGRVLSAPDAQTFHQEAPNGMRITYIISADRNSALAVPEDVPGPGEDRTYQLWTVSGGGQEYVPDQTFDQADGPIVLTGDVESAVALGVTIEPDGGSPQPTMDPFAVQTL